MKKITEAQLKKWNACESGMMFSEEAGFFGLPADRYVERLLEVKRYADSNWLLCHCLSEKSCRSYAVFAAEQVFHLWSKKYPTEAAIWRKWVDAGHPDGDLRDAAWDAAWAAATDAMLEKIIRHGIEILKKEADNGK